MYLIFINVLVVFRLHLTYHLAHSIKLLGHFLLNFLCKVLSLRQSVLYLLRVLGILVVQDLCVRILEHDVDVLVKEHILLLQFIELLLQRLRVSFNLDCVESFEYYWEEVSLRVNNFYVLEI